MKTIFTVGSGRCGTTSIAHQLAILEDVYSIHEGAGGHFMHLMDRPNKWNSFAIQNRIEAINKLKTSGFKHYFEAAHYLSYHLELIEHYFPKSKIVHLLRDPAEVAMSFAQYENGVYGKAQGQHEQNPNWWKSWGDSFPLFGPVPRIEGFLHHWNAGYQKIKQTTLPVYPYYTKDLGDPTKWKALLEWMELPQIPPPPVKNARRVRSTPDQATVRAAHRICADGYKDHGDHFEYTVWDPNLAYNTFMASLKER